jgi:hypothetical protein
VRAAAAPGCCALLDLYWEIIPSATTAAFVAKLTGAPLEEGARPPRPLPPATLIVCACAARRCRLEPRP